MFPCTNCKTEKPITEFYIQRAIKDSSYQERVEKSGRTYRNGKQSWCKDCVRTYGKSRRMNFSDEKKATEKVRHVQAYLSNFPKHWASRQASRAKKAGSSGYVSWEEWQELLRGHDNKCHWCSCELHASFLTLDHVIPLAQAGKHERSNVVPACANCNHKRKWEDSVKYPELYNTGPLQIPAPLRQDG